MAKTPSNMLPLGTVAPDFHLPDPEGRVFSLEELPVTHGLLVMFICNHCPFVVHVAQGIVATAQYLQDKGFAVVAINSNDIEQYPEDSPDKMKEFAKKYQFSFPYLFDESQNIAKAYQAACTPDFYLFNSSRELIYRGQMDKSRPGLAHPNDGSDLIRAVDNELAGQPPLSQQFPSLGCNIKWKS